MTTTVLVYLMYCDVNEARAVLLILHLQGTKTLGSGYFAVYGVLPLEAILLVICDWSISMTY